MNKRLKFLTPIIAVLALTSHTTAMASPADTLQVRRGWYVGAEGGVPFGYGTFSSFGHDKTRVGYNAGLYGGYRFNSVLSLELSAKMGRTTLSARDCCANSGYYLGADGVRYFAPVVGMNTWNYADLKSRVNTQQYGARVNINLLGFFSGTKSSRWSFEVSPAVYAVATKADIMTIAADSKVMSGDTKWHLAYGGRAQVGFMITHNLGVGLYSELTKLTGSTLDDMPNLNHDYNYIWESGIRVGWTFGKGKKKAAPVVAEPASAAPAPAVRPAEPEQPEQPAAPAKAVEEPAAKAEPAVATVAEVAPTFPVIYFDFDKYTIAESEDSKVQEIADTMREHPDMKITLTGWCDKYGTDKVNARISLRRAEAVKARLVDLGIAADRIATVGCGSDLNAENAVSARRVVTEQQ